LPAPQSKKVNKRQKQLKKIEKLFNKKKPIILILPLKPAFSSIRTGYQIIGLLPIGNRHFGKLDARSLIRVPFPPAKTIA
jgi:hypothetical protein